MVTLHVILTLKFKVRVESVVKVKVIVVQAISRRSKNVSVSI